MKVLFFTIATDKYYDFFIDNLHKSLQNHFKIDFDFICFTDKKNNKEFKTITISHLPFPLNTLLRYEIFFENRKVFEKYDYVFYLDADMIMIEDVGDEIISEVVNVIHPGFWQKPRKTYPYEKNSRSTAFVGEDSGLKYYQGCFQGGGAGSFIKMCEVLRENIRLDLKNNIIAEWHDESHMNKYLISNPPTLELAPDYALPSEWLGVKKQCFTEHITENIVEIGVLGQRIHKSIIIEEIEHCNINYESSSPKILHIKKDHESIRK